MKRPKTSSSKAIHLTAFDDYPSPFMGSSLKAKTVPQGASERTALCMEALRAWGARVESTLTAFLSPGQASSAVGRGFLSNFCSDFFFWCYIDLKQGVSFTKSICKLPSTHMHAYIHLICLVLMPPCISSPLAG